MIRSIKKVAVLGSGVMGSRIACHFAGIGVQVLLLDMLAKGAEASTKPAERNRHLAHIEPVQNIPATGWRIETAQNIHQCTLAAARRTHQGHVFIFGYLKRYAFQRLYRLVAHEIAFFNRF